MKKKLQKLKVKLSQRNMIVIVAVSAVIVVALGVFGFLRSDFHNAYSDGENGSESLFSSIVSSDGKGVTFTGNDIITVKSFSGRTHEVITGMALLNKEEDIAEVWSCKSEVKFKKLSDAVIKEYLECVPVLDKAGAYAIQDHGELIVERFSGEMENIIGMPLKKLQLLLKKYSIGGNLVRK